MIGLLIIFFRDVNNEIADSARIAPFIVVPSDQLEKVGVKFESSLSVQDEGVLATNTVTRDNLILGDGHDFFVFLAIRCLLECSHNSVVSCPFLNAYHEIKG